MLDSLQQTFTNPYEHLPPNDMVHRTTIKFSLNAYNRLKRVKPNDGVLQTTINILLHKLINELDKRPDLSGGYNTDAYEYAIANCNIVLGFRTGGIASNSIPSTNIPSSDSSVQRSPAPEPRTGLLAPVSVQADNRDDGRGVEPMAQQAPQQPQPSDSRVKPKRKPTVGGSKRVVVKPKQGEDTTQAS